MAVNYGRKYLYLLPLQFTKIAHFYGGDRGHLAMNFYRPYPGNLHDPILWKVAIKNEFVL
jgi:hypothetical protein